MTQDSNNTSSNRRLAIIGIGAVVLLGAGLAIGLALANDADPPSESGATTTSTAPGATTTPSLSTTFPSTSTTLAPSTTSTTVPAPVELTIPVSGDATVDSDDADEPLGAEDTLEVVLDPPDTLRSLMRFGITGVPDGSTILSATLRMFMIDSSHGGGLLSHVDGDWDEATVTWDTAPAVGPGIAPLPIGSEGRVAEVDVTGAVVGNGPVSFYLTTDSDDDFEIASRESDNGATLIVVVGPEGAGAGDGGVVLVGAGDIASCDSDGDEATAELIDTVLQEEEDVVVFTTGDNVYESGTPAEYANCYDPSWGRHKSIMRPAPGGRDYRTPGATGYFDYFGSAAGEPGKGYYSYDHGAWHIIVINSSCREVQGCDIGSPQVTWLQDDLARNDSLCTLAYWHSPVHSSTVGGDPDLVAIFDLLFEAGVEVVLNGDDHYYERFAPQDAFAEDADEGIQQFTVGTGGRSLSTLDPPVSNSVVRFDEAFGVLALTLQPTRYEWRFIPEAGATFTDTGSRPCH